MSTKTTVKDLVNNPKLFVELMDRYNIKPSDLGIKPTYKYMLKNGLRKPSPKLAQRLLDLIEKDGWRPDPSLGELRSLSDSTATPNAAGLTSGFDMSPGVTRPLWPGRAAVHQPITRGFISVVSLHDRIWIGLMEW